MTSVFQKKRFNMLTMTKAVFRSSESDNFFDVCRLFFDIFRFRSCIHLGEKTLTLTVTGNRNV